jgi:hypothetical protein
MTIASTTTRVVAYLQPEQTKFLDRFEQGRSEAIRLALDLLQREMKAHSIGRQTDVREVRRALQLEEGK